MSVTSPTELEKQIQTETQTETETHLDQISTESDFLQTKT